MDNGGGARTDLGSLTVRMYCLSCGDHVEVFMILAHMHVLWIQSHPWLYDKYCKKAPG